MIVRGKVDRGNGHASRLLREPVFLALAKLHPGSINVFASAPPGTALASSKHPFFRPEEDETLTPDDIRKRGVLPYRDCTLNGHAAFILRTEHPGPRTGTLVSQPNTMFEIVAAEQIPGIAYGTDVVCTSMPRLP